MLIQYRNFPARFILFTFIFTVVVVKVNGYTTTGKSIFHQMYQVQCWQGIIFFFLIILAVAKKNYIYEVGNKTHMIWWPLLMETKCKLARGYLHLCFRFLFVTKTEYAWYEVCKNIEVINTCPICNAMIVKCMGGKLDTRFYKVLSIAL